MLYRLAVLLILFLLFSSVAAAHQPLIAVDAGQPSIGEEAQATDGGPPAPPEGGTGNVLVSVSGEGSYDGVAGVWFVNVIYTFIDFEIVRVTSDSHFEPYYHARSLSDNSNRR